MKNKNCVVCFLILCMILSGCGAGGNSENSTGTSANNLIQQANAVGNAASQNSKNTSGDMESILDECNSFMSDCWNPVCDLDWYTSTGTSSTGGDLDADFTIDKFEDAYKDKDQYDSEMNGISDSYSFEKLTWDKAMQEFDKVAAVLQDRDSIIAEKGSGTSLGIDYLEDYVHEFSDLCLKDKQDPNSSAGDDQTILSNCNAFLSDCWNPICDLDWYTSSGTSATGKDLDAEYTIAKLNYYYQDKDIYNNMMQSVSDDYSLAKKAWERAISEMDSIVSYVNSNSEKVISSRGTGSLLDVSKLQDYVHTFSDEANG